MLNMILSLWAMPWLKWTLWFTSVVWSWWTIHHFNTVKVRDCCPGALQPGKYINPECSRKITITLNVLVFTQHISLGLAVHWNNPLIKGTHVGKEKHFSTLSLSWAELARLLLVICWGLVRAPPWGISEASQARHGMCSPGPPHRSLLHAGLCCGHHHLCGLPLVSWQTRQHKQPSHDLGVWPGGWRRRRVAVVQWGMLPGVSESHSITLSSWALLRRAAGTSRSHLGRSGAWQGAAGRLQLLFKPWQQSSISVSQQETQGAQQSRT